VDTTTLHEIVKTASDLRLLLYGLVLAILLFARERYDLSWPSLFRRTQP
jgi:hypothetical protein